MIDMRDPERIAEILDRLEMLWTTGGNEDMRFGQLLENYVYRDAKVKWHEEDSVLIARLDVLLKPPRKRDMDDCFRCKKKAAFMTGHFHKGKKVVVCSWCSEKCMRASVGKSCRNYSTGCYGKK